MQEIDVEQQYNVRADGVTDNTAALMAMRADLAGRGNKAVRILLPHGIIKYTNNRWLYGIERFELDSKGLTQLLVDYTGTDDVFQRPLFVGEMFQNNTLAYVGTKEYEDPTQFDAAPAGSTDIKLLPTPLSTGGSAPAITDTTRFFAGAYLLLFYYNQVGEGYPPGARYWERVQIKEVNTATSTLTLETPLVYSYRTDVWTVDRSQDDGLNVGQPALISLDRPQNVQCKYAKIANVKALRTTGGANGYWAITADTLELHSIKNPDNPYWPQENTTRATYVDCEFNSSEHDKLTGLVENIRTTVVHDINNGGGCKRIVLDGCNTGDALQIVSPYTSYKNGVARANSYPDVYSACFDEYPSRAPREEVVFENYIFTNGPLWQGNAYINTGEHVAHTIQAVSGSTIVLPPSYYKSREVSSWKEGFILFREDGQKGGTITRIYADPAAASPTSASIFVDGTWSSAPVVGEVWKWCPVKTVIDNGGLRKGINNALPLWSSQAKRWQGNRSREAIKQTTFSFADLFKNSVATLIEYNAFILSIEISVASPNAQGNDNFIQLTTNANQPAGDPYTPRVELGRINLQTPGLRKFDQIGSYGIRPTDRLDNNLTMGFVRDVEFFHPSLVANPPHGSVTITWQTF